MKDEIKVDQLKENTQKYWDERYQNSKTDWDMNQVSPPLKIYIDSLNDKKINILIPGCGNAYEAEYLLQCGFENVSLVDISKTLTDKLKEKFKNNKIKIYNEDFFNHSGKYDLILEQTFFCALYPELRRNYIDHCEKLLKQEGKMAGVLFYKKMVGSEPPFIASYEEYMALFSPKFTFNILEPCTNSIAPRLGSELFFEIEKIKI